MFLVGYGKRPEFLAEFSPEGLSSTQYTVQYSTVHGVPDNVTMGRGFQHVRANFIIYYLFRQPVHFVKYENRNRLLLDLYTNDIVITIIYL